MTDPKKFLKQIKMLNIRIENTRVEAEQWRAMAEGGTAAYGTERVQTSPNPDKMANALNRCHELEQEAEKEVARCAEIKQDIINVIRQVDNPYEYDILHKVYIQGMSLKEYAAKKGKDYNTITTAHGRALAKVEHILREREAKRL